MKKSERLRAQRSKVVDRMTVLSNIAASEARKPTAEEDAEFQRLKSEVEGLDRDIPAAEAEELAAVNAGQTQEQLAAAKAEGVRLERERVTAITQRGTAAKLDGTFINGLISEGLTAEQATSKIFEELAKEKPEEKIRPHQTARVTSDATEKMRAEMTAALLYRHDSATYPLKDGFGRQYVGMSLMELAKESLDARGIPTRGESKDRIAKLALTTSDFPLITADVARKTLRRSYEAAPQTWRLFSRQITLPDFKKTSRTQLSEAPKLEKVNEHGEFKYGSLGEGREQIQLITYGKIVHLTRQVIINDDLDAFSRIPAAFGVAAANLESDTVWGIITGNPTMSDGNALFHASHNNLATGGGSALALAGMAAAFGKLTTAKGLDGLTYLSLQPRYVAVPVALQLTVAQFLGTLAPATAATVIPDYLKAFTPIVEPRLDANSATAWYVFADPAMIDTIEYAYLEGEQGVFLDQEEGFDMDGVKFKARLDFAAKPIDYRGMIKSVGA